MIHLDTQASHYMDEINEGILEQLNRVRSPGRDILDVGCGRAALGEAIRARGWNVVGIEQEPDAVAVARTRLKRVIVVDLQEAAVVAQDLAGFRFDVLVFSDVLEHVYHPLRVLQLYLPLLKPGGTLLVSVPNAVTWDNRLRWLFGEFRYSDSGIMDRTHIRFFTFKTARELVEAAGFKIEEVDSTPQIVRAFLPLIKTILADREQAQDPRALIDSKTYRSYMKFFYPVEKWLAHPLRTMLAFRIVIRATRRTQ
ncbi:MAG: class I SAM-dependent methyltransferase [Deltaproteobacteria bacterium]|nr:class I SAM-dependent methyltransferase [Deltaproteobacteria bacterium]